MDKTLAFVTKIGPAFTAEASEIEQAHAALDAIGAPRELYGLALSLKERIEFFSTLTLQAEMESYQDVLDLLDRGVQ